MPARTTALRSRSRGRDRRSCRYQLPVNMGEHARKLFDAPNPLGAAGSEHIGKWVDARGPDADVVHGDAGRVGFFIRVRYIGPRIATLVAFVGHQTVANHDE